MKEQLCSRKKKFKHVEMKPGPTKLVRPFLARVNDYRYCIIFNADFLRGDSLLLCVSLNTINTSTLTLSPLAVYGLSDSPLEA